MKTYMKKLTAAFMAVAMILSLSVSAFASGLPAAQTDSQSKVTTQGGLPADLVTVVMPTAPANGQTGLFSIIFDSQDLIFKTGADRYVEEDGDGGQVAFDQNTQFYFKNYTNTPVDTTDTLLADEGSQDTQMKAGDKVVVYKKATWTSIYAKLDSEGKLDKWQKANSTAAADVEDNDWKTGGAFVKIASLEKLDPLSGFGLDAIDKLNENDPTLYLYKKGVVDTSGSAFLNMVEYVFVSSYSETAGDDRYVEITVDSNGAEQAPAKAFSTLGTAPSTAPTPVTVGSGNGEASFANVTKADGSTVLAKSAIMTVGTDTFCRTRTNKAILSFRKDSTPLKVVNKTNADVGVTMSATLSNLPGGDGTKVNSVQTFVYAKAITFDSTNNVTEFYKDTDTTVATNKITVGNDGVPAIYMALKGTDNAATPNTTTEVMAYDTVKKTASAQISTVVSGQDSFYNITWDGTSADDPNGKYIYALKPTSYDKREADFNSMTFQLTGAIDKDDDVWDTLSTGATAPAISVTWKVETVDNLKAPTVVAPTTAFKATAVWTWNVTVNSDLLVLSKVYEVTNGGDVEVDPSKITANLNAKTGLGTIAFAANTFSAKPTELKFEFAHPTKAFNTKKVSVPLS